MNIPGDDGTRDTCTFGTNSGLIRSCFKETRMSMLKLKIMLRHKKHTMQEFKDTSIKF